MNALFAAAGALGSIIAQGVLAGLLAFFAYVLALHLREWGIKAWHRGMAARDALIKEWEGQ
jgi:hypothetical protein